MSARWIDSSPLGNLMSVADLLDTVADGNTISANIRMLRFTADDVTLLRSVAAETGYVLTLSDLADRIEDLLQQAQP